MRTLEQLKNVAMGQMSPEEQKLVFRAAADRLKRQIESNADAFKVVLDAEYPAADEEGKSGAK